MKNNKVKFIFVALLFATQVEAFSSCSTSSVNEENKEQETPPDSPSVSPPVEETAYAFPGAEGGGMNTTGEEVERYILSDPWKTPKHRVPSGMPSNKRSLV